VIGWFDTARARVVACRQPIGPGPLLGETMTPLIRVCGQFFVALVGLADRESRVRGARLVAALPLVLSSALVSVPALAYGGGPATILMTGVFDDADPDGLMIDGAPATVSGPGKEPRATGRLCCSAARGRFPAKCGARR
jgi:hypothetical protein